ncbi:hypothetical protein PQX77_001761 [Marasmius sp. AFHP31]|nr:hypothetical protein PQX77_001761 [Marasmius sp. AFHP31]
MYTSSNTHLVDVDMDSESYDGKDETRRTQSDLAGCPSASSPRGAFTSGTGCMPGPVPDSFAGPSTSLDTSTPVKPHHKSNDWNTQNDGDCNETYNSSYVYREQKYDRRAHGNAVVHVHVHQRANSPPTSPPHDRDTSDFSKNSFHASLLTPPTSDSDSSPQSGIFGNVDEEQTRTRSHIYELLLLQCGLGFPLWMPSPRCTPDGEYELDIGDVGVLSHGLPFNTLFNITQSPTSPANKDGIPEGVNPPCALASRWLTIKQGYHPPETVLIRPARAISRQEAQASVEFNSFTFHLSTEGGALLMLPQGGTLKRLEKTAGFKERVRHHWRQWYDFAEDQVDLDDGQALYLVTGVEKCTTWAMASWDAVPNIACDELGSLELTVDGTTGACSWAFPPARCSTQSSDSLITNSPQSGQETIFVRGFRIDRFNGSMGLQPPGFSSRPGKEKDNGGGSTFRGNDLRDLPSFDSSVNPSSSTRYECSGGGGSGALNPQSDALDPLIDNKQILELNLNLSDNEKNFATHPCEAINKFAFELVSHIKPALLNTGCVVISHDDDWINIIQESDEGIPPEAEIIRRICSNFKFALEGDTIFPVSMTDSDMELLRQREAPSLQGLGGVIPALLEFWEDTTVLTTRPSADFTRDMGMELHRYSQDNSTHSRSLRLSSTTKAPTEEPAWLEDPSAINYGSSAQRSPCESWPHPFLDLILIDSTSIDHTQVHTGKKPVHKRVRFSKQQLSTHDLFVRRPSQQEHSKSGVHELIGYSHTPTLNFDVTLPISALTSRFQSLSSLLLAEPAVKPAVSSLVLTTHHLPWSITIYPSNGYYVSVRDVLDAIYHALRKNVSHQEYQSCHDKLRVNEAYQCRYDRIRDYASSREEKAGGVKRVDFLCGRTRFMGISPTSKRDVWEVRLDYHRSDGHSKGRGSGQQMTRTISLAGIP